jgi:aldehyde dehydrogenase (NAD+)
MRHYGHFIDGDEKPSISGEYFPTENPYTGETWAFISRGDAADVDAAVAAAKRAGEGQWGSLSATERGRLMRRLADLILEEAAHLAEIEMTDNGKLYAEALVQARYMSDYFHYYAGLADKVEGQVIPTDKAGVFTYTKYEAKGVVGIITPWNSPLSLASWKIAPALAAGCTVVAKPSEYTSASTLELARLVERAGFPAGVMNVVTGYGKDVGEPLVAHPDVAHVGFTGGGVAGRAIYALAASHLKTVTLELGGKSPNIIFDDADLDEAIKGAVAGIFAATGQSCQAGSRLLVHESIHDEVVQRLLAYVADIRLGDPAAPDTQVGPVANKPQFEKILSYIEIAKSEGAICVAGGKARTDIGSGQFIEPTIFTGVVNSMRIAQEEVFGPVLTVIPFKDEDDAIRIGNDVVYGLAAAVWTKSLRRAMLLTDKLKAGTIWVNNYRATSFTSPFGGFKQSGVGRESGQEAIKEYLETKCVWISSDLVLANPFVKR